MKIEFKDLTPPDDRYDIAHECPACHFDVVFEGFRFCPGCGQPLEWEYDDTRANYYVWRKNNKTQVKERNSKPVTLKRARDIVNALKEEQERLGLDGVFMFWYEK